MVGAQQSIVTHSCVLFMKIAHGFVENLRWVHMNVVMKENTRCKNNTYWQLSYKSNGNIELTQNRQEFTINLLIYKEKQYYYS